MPTLCMVWVSLLAMFSTDSPDVCGCANPHFYNKPSLQPSLTVVMSSFFIQFKITYSYFCTRLCTYARAHVVRGQFSGVGSLLQPHRFQGSNLARKHLLSHLRPPHISFIKEAFKNSSGLFSEALNAILEGGGGWGGRIKMEHSGPMLTGAIFGPLFYAMG